MKIEKLFLSCILTASIMFAGSSMLQAQGVKGTQGKAPANVQTNAVKPNGATNKVETKADNKKAENKKHPVVPQAPVKVSDENKKLAGIITSLLTLGQKEEVKKAAEDSENKAPVVAIPKEKSPTFDSLKADFDKLNKEAAKSKKALDKNLVDIANGLIKFYGSIHRNLDKIYIDQLLVQGTGRFEAILPAINKNYKDLTAAFYAFAKRQDFDGIKANELKENYPNFNIVLNGDEKKDNEKGKVFGLINAAEKLLAVNNVIILVNDSESDATFYFVHKNLHKVKADQEFVLAAGEKWYFKKPVTIYFEKGKKLYRKNWKMPNSILTIREFTEPN